ELLNEDVKINREYKQIRKIQTRENKKKQIEKFKEDQKISMSEKQKAKSRRNLQKKNRKVLTIEEKKKRLKSFEEKKNLRDFYQQEFPNFGNSSYVEYEKKFSDIIDQKGKEFLATRSSKPTHDPIWDKYTDSDWELMERTLVPSGKFRD
ncbi:hypothetical protein, partial [Sulfuricurvum sp.]|uniref:hypothetical protein n=1 Tax=Sulfuricurvum sp. TaxID=2025608 RepID=UPI003BB5D5FC